MKRSGFVLLGIILVFTISIYMISTETKYPSSAKDDTFIAQSDTSKKARFLRYIITEHSGSVTPAIHDQTSYNYREWVYFNEYFAGDIKVTWPDGNQTIGSGERNEVLLSAFAHAPDARILEHPVKYVSATKTGVIATITGTFTEPMTDTKGRKIKPTGKTFAIPIYAVGVWENGVMVEEYVYWDDSDHREQIGVSGKDRKPLRQIFETLWPKQNNEIIS